MAVVILSAVVCATSPATGQGPSCDGVCGGIAPDRCWCDAACCIFEDCCPDKCEACGTTNGDCDNDGPCEPMCPTCDEAKCPGDLTDSGSVGVPDLLALLSAWGPCADPDGCPGCFGDLTCSAPGSVGVPDLLKLLSNWGPCAPEPVGCEGFCMSVSPDGCWCDQACFNAGDCCEDICDHCGWVNPATCEPPPPDCCEGVCGATSWCFPGCWCDQQCFQFDDCCPDVCDHCDFPQCEPGPPPLGSCADPGGCGGQSPDGCWCDQYCFTAGDCCEDICDRCGFLNCDPDAPPACKGACWAQSPFGCWCDGLCHVFGDCCYDVCEQCADADPPIVACHGDRMSCEGFCGTNAPGGCWCDEECCSALDCCDDKFEACGGCSP